MKRQTKTLLTALALIGSASAVSAGTIKVDLGRSDGGGSASGAAQAGYTGWTIAGNQGAMDVSETFASTYATDGTIDVTMTSNSDTFARNYGNTISGTQSGLQALLEDFVFFNQDGGGSNFIQFQFDDLKAGEYTFTALHHFTQANSNFPTMDILLNGVDTTDNIAMVQGTGINTLNTSVVNFTVVNDNDAVTIRYANPVSDNPEGNEHFGINGFELTRVPEPGSLALLAMGGLCVLRRRRR